LQTLTLNSFIIVSSNKISNANCLDEAKIHVDTLLYLHFINYLLNDLVNLPNPTISYVATVGIYEKAKSGVDKSI